MKLPHQDSNKKVSYRIAIFLTILGIITSSILTYLILHTSTEQAKSTPQVASATTAQSDCTDNVVSLSGYKLVKPLLYSEKECESASLATIKGDIGNFIEEQKKAGVLTNASVYLRVLSTQEWTSVNPNEGYYPGSLIKLPMLIAFLRMEEAKPGYLSQKVTFNSATVTDIKQTYQTKAIENGHSYTLKELIEYMIAYSDNNATQLLNSYLKIDAINNVFKDIGLTPPPANADYFNYKMTAKDYSKFMIGIYNSSYLSNTASEYAAELLSKSDFKEGLAKLLPPNVKIAHKFGEAGHGDAMELHESGIIFINDKPYQITIMSRGGNVQKLSEVLSQISKMVYDRFNAPAV